MAAFDKLKRLIPFQSSYKNSNFKYSHYLNSMPLEKLQEILLFSEAEQVLPLVPSLQEKSSLFFNDSRHRYLFKRVLTKNPSHMINMVYMGNEVQKGVGYMTLYAHMDRLPLRHLQFDVIVAPLVLNSEVCYDSQIQMLARRLKNGGRMIICVRHPELEHMLFNQNPSYKGAPENSVSGYYQIFKRNKLFVEDMKEGVVDANMKPFFTLDGEYDHYHDYKNLPLSLVYKLVKFERS